MDNKKIIIDYPTIINGNDLRSNDIKQAFSWFISSFIRGSEIYIEPDAKTYNIFIER